MEKIRAQKKHFAAGLITVGLVLIGISAILMVNMLRPHEKTWDVQSIDTMKYSRDIAREKLNDQSFDAVIEQQVENIARTGATHVSIGTPYDEEFIPFMKRWVSQARKAGLNVWFRGNFSGWEEWFGYEKIDREEHKRNIEDFITSNPALFEDGDIFSPCPECENGGPGDPRITRDVEGHRKFLIEEYDIARKAFTNIGKDVRSNFMSMNYDVAQLIMDEKTTAGLGGIVTIDHYVSTPERLNNDILQIAKQSRGKVVLGEFGNPIPDIHGKQGELEQAEWLSKALSLISKNEHLIGVNYWVNVGGSTALWDSKGQPRASVEELERYYKPQ